MININKQASFNNLLFRKINNTENEHENMSHKNITKYPSLFDSNHKRFNSKNNLLDNIDNNKLKSNRNQTIKKSNKISRQLNIITKNIENTSNNINNPDEFYSNFFKSIIDKKSQMISNSSHNNTKTPSSKKIEHKIGTNLFNYYLKEKNINSYENKGEINSEK